MKSRYFYFLLCVLVGQVAAFAQKKKQMAEPFGYHFVSKNQKVARVPFDISSNLMVMKVTIDKSDTLNFILDTGVSSIILTDTLIPKKLGWGFIRKVQLTGAGEGDPLVGHVTVGHTIRMGDVQATQQNIVCLETDILQISEFLGIPIHGIFGHAIFNEFVVTIDFVNRELVLTRPSHFKYKKRMGEKLPIVVSQSKPYTDAIYLKTGGQWKPARLVIDTGAGHALMLNHYARQNPLPLPGRTIRANLGRGLNGDINGHIGRIGGIQVGDIQMKEVLASFPDSVSFGMKFPETDRTRQGSIGCELLRRFKVTLNYTDGYMLLKPVKERVKEPFEHDMSGLVIKTKGQKLNNFVIEKVIEESPAYVAGLRGGEEIVFFNGQPVSTLTINEMYKLLSRKEGKEIELFVRKNGHLIFYYFKLQRVI